MCFIKLRDTLTGQLLFVKEGDGFSVTTDPFKAKSFKIKSQETLDWFDKFETNLHGLFPAPQWHVTFMEEETNYDEYCTDNGSAARGSEATSGDPTVRTEEQQQPETSVNNALDDAINRR
jgi:hypothetical protein